MRLFLTLLVPLLAVIVLICVWKGIIYVISFFNFLVGDLHPSLVEWQVCKGIM